MKHLFLLALIFFCMTVKLTAFETKIQSADDLNMTVLKELALKTGYTDHIPHFRKIFEKYQVRVFLEFGLGYSTKFFLDNCEKVVSIEFVTLGNGAAWMKECLSLYENYSNWLPIAYFSEYHGDTSWAKNPFFGSPEVYAAAAYQCTDRKNYALINNAYMMELEGVLSTLVSHNSIDAAFIDAGVYIRGDLVQLMFNKAPIIVAHDARCRARNEKDDVYAYCRISVPENYEEFFIDAGMGTMVWIKKGKEFTELKEGLQTYIATKGWLNGWD